MRYLLRRREINRSAPKKRKTIDRWLRALSPVGRRPNWFCFSFSLRAFCLPANRCLAPPSHCQLVPVDRSRYGTMGTFLVPVPHKARNVPIKIMRLFIQRYTSVPTVIVSEVNSFFLTTSGLPNSTESYRKYARRIFVVNNSLYRALMRQLKRGIETSKGTPKAQRV